jgi:hypothetical protein
MVQRLQQELIIIIIIIIIIINNIMQRTKEILWFHKYELRKRIRILGHVIAIGLTYKVP